MNAVSNECVGLEVDVELVNESEAGLVEVGAVSETKGGFIGSSLDNGAGFQRV